jgi:hypothetical protein
LVPPKFRTATNDVPLATDQVSLRVKNISVSFKRKMLYRHNLMEKRKASLARGMITNAFNFKGSPYHESFG